MAFHLEHVVEGLVGPTQNPFKEALSVNSVQREPTAIIGGINDRHLGGVWTQYSSELATLKFSDPQKLEWIEMPRFYQGIEVIVGKRGGIHKFSLAPRGQTPRRKRKFLAEHTSPLGR